MDSSIPAKLYVVDEKVSYWLVRSNNGQYYDAFYKGGFIAIGWNHIDPGALLDIKQAVSTKTIIEAKANEEKEVFARENNAKFKPVTKAQVGAIYRQLRNFISLKAGDIVMVPSQSSNRYLIGTILDDKIYTDQVDQSCPYFKRRKVSWADDKPVYELPANLRQLKNIQHTISEIDSNLHEAIQSLVNPLFVMKGSTNFRLELKHDGEIKVVDLIGLLDSLQKLSEYVNIEYGLNENVSLQTIQLSLQSPGFAKFKQTGVALGIATLLIVQSACTTTTDINSLPSTTDLQEIQVSKRDLIDSAKEIIEKMRGKDTLITINNEPRINIQ